MLHQQESMAKPNFSVARKVTLLIINSRLGLLFRPELNSYADGKFILCI